MLEKRTFTRVDYDVEATLQYEGEEFTSQILKLSPKGALVNTGASPMKGHSVAIKFWADLGGKPIGVCCPGRVIRADSKGIGIEFEGLDMDTFKRLRDIVVANSFDPSLVVEEFEDFVWRWEEHTEAEERPAPPQG